MAPIYELGKELIRPIDRTSFKAKGLGERSDLQRLLRDQIEVVAPDTLVISEEFGEWTDSRRRIDLLGVDKDANLVVIELKRTEDGGHMELQAVRYASMVSTLTAERAVEVFGKYLEDRGHEGDPEQLLLEHLEWEELDEDQFGQDVRLVLISADFSRELTTAVMWLNDKDLDIRCVRIKPYADQGKTLIDVQQIIPLPEAGDYQVQVREKKRQERRSRQGNRDVTRFDVTLDGETHRGQWKRNGILLVVKSLVRQGISPEEISAFFKERKKGNTILSVEGEVEAVEQFNERAIAEARVLGKAYDERRWHTHQDDLMLFTGRTYVFTNQWGNRWLEFMRAIQEEYPQLGLKISPSEEGEGR